jgi:hypothetical protein
VFIIFNLVGLVIILVILPKLRSQSGNRVVLDNISVRSWEALSDARSHRLFEVKTGGKLDEVAINVRADVKKTGHAHSNKTGIMCSGILLYWANPAYI